MGFFALFVFLLIIEKLDSLPTGAPATACSTLMPQHLVSSQPFPTNSFNLSFGSFGNRYIPGQDVEVSIQGNSDFRGFMVESRSPQNRLVGDFYPSPGQTILDCPDGTAITHSNNSLKNFISFSYAFPSNFSEDIQFRFTVVICFMSSPCNGTSLFWANIPGPIVSFDNFINVSAGCDVSKGCIGVNFEGCRFCSDSNDCDMFITWRQNLVLNIMEFEILSNSEGRDYAALGLSTDQRMGRDDVLLCHRESFGSLNFIASDAWNPFERSATEIDSNQDGITLIHSYTSGNTFYCRFARSIPAPDPSTGYNISNQSILLASGIMVSNTQIIQHTRLPCTTSIINFAQVTPGTVDIPNFSLLKAHALLMILTWQILIAFGIFMARYTKPSFPNGEWYHTHRFVNSFALFSGLSGFILIFIYVGGWSIGSPILTAHQIIGISTIFVLLVNPLIAVFRCKPNNKFRWIFNLIHGVFGLYAELAALSTVFIGLWLFYNIISDGSRPGFWIFVGWQISVFLIFDFPFIIYRLYFIFSKESNTSRTQKDISLEEVTGQKNNVLNVQTKESIWNILFHNIFSLPSILPKDQRKNAAREWPIVIFGMSLFIAFNLLAYILMIVFISLA